MNKFTVVTGKISQYLESIQDEFDSLKRSKECLMEENRKLKTNAWKDEELEKMREELEELNSGFPIYKDELPMIKDFKEKHPHHSFHYVFYPTGLGTVAEIHASNGDKLTFRELS